MSTNQMRLIMEMRTRGGEVNVNVDEDKIDNVHEVMISDNNGLLYDSDFRYRFTMRLNLMMFFSTQI